MTTETELLPVEAAIEKMAHEAELIAKGGVNGSKVLMWAEDHGDQLALVLRIFNKLRRLTPSGAGEGEVSDAAVDAATLAFYRSRYPDENPETFINIAEVEMRAALTAALPYLLPAQSQDGVKVKPLVWKRGDGTQWSSECWKAETIVGRYVVIERQWWGPEPTDHVEETLSDDEAKSAAQADYEARIRSAVTQDGGE